MPCVHKFWGHPSHLIANDSLLPNWSVDTLIIGTFNPTNDWVPTNIAEYYYGRSRYFWKVLPKFACIDAIENLDVAAQLVFLQNEKIGLTDLLISIDDADITIPDHVRRIRSFRDNDLIIFEQFQWNTDRIINLINTNHIKAVYLTRSGIYNDIFDVQLTEIENQTGVTIARLHTPTGQGLGRGIPRINRLIHKWWQQGANYFPFLCPNFDINNPEFFWD